MSEENQNNGLENFQYQAEVSQIMDIVVNSLYTDREIFVRELVSNAVDALEKVRHLTLTEDNIHEKDAPLEITISLDEEKNTFTISDTGKGMIRDELINDLGQIAHSGSREFLKELAENMKKDVSLIGQFGVGFYSAFMVAKSITVQTRSYLPISQAYEWKSTGQDGFTISSLDNHHRGTTIILELKDDATEFAKEFTIKQNIKKYSNFVPFPIKLKDETVNIVEAIWTRNKNEITDEEYTEFYKYTAGAFDEPLDKMHFSTDAPLALTTLLFIPTENMERLGFSKLEPAVDLHCRKVLIEKQAKGIIPQWMRFLKGVVDSEDIPLNISRETMQDSALIRRISKAITGKFIRFLQDKVKNDEEGYNTFWKTFGTFIKEGIISDFENKQKLAPLLRYETSKTEPDELITLKQYVERMPEDQKEIYFLNGESRDVVTNSPYLEIFRKRDIEVIFSYDPADDFVMSHLETFEEKKLVSADASRLDLPDSGKEEDKETDDTKKSDSDHGKLRDWMKKVLKDKVADVIVSRRLVGSPVLLVNPDEKVTGAMHRLMQAMNKEMASLVSLTLEFNPDHHLIRKLDTLRSKDALFAESLMEQLLDHAAMTSGYTIEPTTMVDRMYTIMDRAMEHDTQEESGESEAENK